MDPVIPARAWRFTDDHLDVINEDVEQFKKLDIEATQWWRDRGTLPVFGILPPYCMVLAGFKTPIEFTAWDAENGRYGPDLSRPAGEFLAKEIGKFRANSRVFQELGIDHIINVNMPQNTLVVAPPFSDLPILLMYGLMPGEDMVFDMPGLVEMKSDEAQLLGMWLQAMDDKERSAANERESGA